MIEISFFKTEDGNSIQDSNKMVDVYNNSYMMAGNDLSDIHSCITNDRHTII